MPILCGLFDHVAQGWVTSELAKELYDALQKRSIPVVVPHLYLEEMAAHLLGARHYRPLIGVDATALGRSENFFVAHFHSVNAFKNETVRVEAFDEFLRDFGLPDNCDTLDFFVAKRRVEKEMREQLNYYQIPVIRVTYTSGVPLPNEPNRDEKVLNHDRCVANWLDSRSADNFSEGFVLCTQDRWLLNAVGERDWLALDAATLVDLIQLTRPKGAVTSIACARELALRLDDGAASRAAAVWDFLAKLEGANLANRSLLQHARRFKDDWLQRKRETELPQPEDWQRFKEKLIFE
jgi:hypothetical protein